MTALKRISALLFCLLHLSACREGEVLPVTAVASPPPTATEPVNDQETAVEAPTTAPTDLPPTPPPMVEVKNIAIDPATIEWPAPAKHYAPLSREPVLETEINTAALLTAEYPPDREDVDLFITYKGIDETAYTPPVASGPLSVGTIEAITVHNSDLNTNATADFELKLVSDHAYFWFDTTPGLIEPSSPALNEMGSGFDQIYEDSHALFGSEDSPGVDGDPRIHIVNASPVNLCDVTVSQVGQCWLAGYFSSHDLVPKHFDPTSNAREMFVMNGRAFGSDAYLDTLAHEFRHMVEENYDVNDWDWEVEGSAMLAEELLGFPGDGVARANIFLSQPDQQLNRWSEDNTTPRYGQGYLFNRYLFNRLGTDLYREFAIHPASAFVALDEIASRNGTDFDSGLALWLDWLVALAIHDEPNIPEKYELRNGLSTAAATSLTSDMASTVHQYAVDYYNVIGSGGQTLFFTGSNHVPIMQVQPTSGSSMWLANRANYSSPTLIGTFDLSAVETATLNYDVFRDIETGYDFAYVTISTDDGQSWQPLSGPQMQGSDFEDNPGDAALTERFYTGRAQDWVRESIDLTPYVGQPVQIRFEYVTDPILTYSGLALDNITIPEIGFVDDAETDTGWRAEGFVRATGYVPQAWYLTLVTFIDNEVQIHPISLNDDNTAEISIPPGNSRTPLLIVAAVAPMTLQPAHYQIEFQ